VVREELIEVVDLGPRGAEEDGGQPSPDERKDGSPPKKKFSTVRVQFT